MKVRTITTSLLYLAWPLTGFLVSLKRFRTFLGYCSFVLFGIFINLNMHIRVQDDIARYISGYNYYLLGVPAVADKDFYYPLTSLLFSSLNIPAICIFIFWSAVYYTGYYLCLKLLLKYTKCNALGIVLSVAAVFFIPIMEFSTIRYFTGCFFLIYFLVKVETKHGNLRSTLPLWIAPFMHFMHLPVVVLYYLYRYVKPGLRVLFVIFLITWAMSFVDYSGIIQSMGLYENTSYLDSSYLDSIEASYQLGKYLYLPLLASLWIMIFIQYSRSKSLDETNVTLLKLALFSMIVYNLVSPSADFYGRFRRVSEWLMAFPIMYYYQKTKDRTYLFFVFVFPVCFILSNWDFLFVSGPKMFNYVEILTSNFFNAFAQLSQQIANL